MNGTAPPGFMDRLRVPGYLILVSAMVLPVIDLAFILVPPQTGMISWRYGAVTLFSGTVFAPLFLLYLFYALAVLLEDRPAIIAVAAVASLLALVLIASVGTFSLDGIDMKARVQPQAQARFVQTAIQALVKLLFEAVAATVLAVSAFRGLRDSTPAESERSRAAGSLIVARRTSSRAAKTPGSGIRPSDPGSADAPTTAETPDA